MGPETWSELRIKKILIVFFGLTLLAFSFKLIFAQNEQTDYDYQYESYTKDYQDFIKTRDEYVQYQTLTSKEVMMQALQRVLLQRDEAQRAYWLLLRKELRDCPGLILSEKNRLISYLTQEIIFLESHKQKIAEANQSTLQDLINFSTEFDDKKEKYLTTSYEILSQLLSGQIKDMQVDLVAINSLFTQELDAYPADKKNIYQSWVEEAASQTLQSQQKTSQAEEKLVELKEESEEKGIKKVFSTITGLLQDSQLYLQKAFAYQQELLGRLSP